MVSLHVFAHRLLAAISLALLACAPSHSSVSIRQQADSIQQISLRRTGCLGTCPINEFTLDRSGSATFHGEAYSTLVGRYQATLDSGDFASLAQTLVRNGVLTVDTAYDEPVTDMPTTFLCVRLIRLERCIRRYGGLAPSPIRRLEEPIDSMFPGLKWKRIGE